MSIWLFFPGRPRLPCLIGSRGERGIFGAGDRGGDRAVEFLRGRPRPRLGEASDAEVAEPALSFLFALLAAFTSLAFFFLAVFTITQ